MQMTRNITTDWQIECCPLPHHHYTPQHALVKWITCRPSQHCRPCHHSVQRHVHISCMVGICQRTEQRQDRNIMNHMKCRGFLYSEHPSADGIAAKADEALFSVICMNPIHVLGSFLSHPKQHRYQLRTRAHSFSLPPKDDRNLSRNLYRNIY